MIKLNAPFALLGGLFFLIVAGCQPAETTQGSPADRSVDAPETAMFPDSVRMQQGMEITTEAFRKLSGELEMAMKEGGVASALPYCNLMAYPLTDSVAVKHGVKLRRTALRYRNPDNAPTDAETAQLKAFAASLQEGKPPQPALSKAKGRPVTFYRPILLKDGCLRCHGTVGEDIAEEDIERIRSLYPKDKATGFKTGDLRGMWVLEFGKQ